MPTQKTSILTKQRVATRTIVTVALAIFGVAALAAAGTFFTRNAYRSAYYGNNQANNQANNAYVPGDVGSLEMKVIGVRKDYRVLRGSRDVVLAKYFLDARNSLEDIEVYSVEVQHTAKTQNTQEDFENLQIIADDIPASWKEMPRRSDKLVNQYTLTFDLDKRYKSRVYPLIIPKGTAKMLYLIGDTIHNREVSTAGHLWGLAPDARVVAKGRSSDKDISVKITPSSGQLTTLVLVGRLIIEGENNPASAIVLSGERNVVFSNIKLSAQYEDLRLDKLTVYVDDGGYSFTTGHPSNYMDVANVGIYDGMTKLAEGTIPSNGSSTFHFDPSAIRIPKDSSKILRIKADMATVDPNYDNAPGTNSADLKIGLHSQKDVKTTGLLSNFEISGMYERYHPATTSAMILRSAKPSVTLPSFGRSLGAATDLTNGSICMYSFRVSADPRGNDVLLYRNTFVFGLSPGMSLNNVYVKDQYGNTIKEPGNVSNYGPGEVYFTATYNNPNFSSSTYNNPNFSSSEENKEAIVIPAGQSRTFKVCGTVTGAGLGKNIATFLAGDTAFSSNRVNIENTADFFSVSGAKSSNFIWSDNYQQKSVTGINMNNVTTTPQWYNGHLVPGLENAVRTTPYVIGWH